MLASARSLLGGLIQYGFVTGGGGVQGRGLGIGEICSFARAGPTLKPTLSLISPRFAHSPQRTIHRRLTFFKFLPFLDEDGVSFGRRGDGE